MTTGRSPPRTWRWPCTPTSPATRPACRVHYAAALELADAAGDVPLVVRVRANMAAGLEQQGRFAEALATITPAVALAEQAGYASMLAMALSNEGVFLHRLGRLDEAVARQERSAEIYQRTHSHKVAYPLVALGDVHRRRGRLQRGQGRVRRGRARQRIRRRQPPGTRAGAGRAGPGARRRPTRPAPVAAERAVAAAAGYAAHDGAARPRLGGAGRGRSGRGDPARRWPPRTPPAATATAPGWPMRWSCGRRRPAAHRRGPR